MHLSKSAPGFFSPCTHFLASSLSRRQCSIVLVGLAPDHALFQQSTSTTQETATSSTVRGAENSGVVPDSAAGAPPSSAASVAATDLGSAPAPDAASAAAAAVPAAAGNECNCGLEKDPSADTAPEKSEAGSKEHPDCRSSDKCSTIELTVDFNVGKRDRTTMHAQGKSKQVREASPFSRRLSLFFPSLF